MKILLMGAIGLIGMALQPSPAMAIRIDLNGNVTAAFSPDKDDSRIFPGNYYFRKGSEEWNSGNVTEAVQLWKTAASWGQKSAQYNLGIAFYTGEGVERNPALGLAWLGLAAERHHPVFQESLDIAWYQSSVAIRTDGKKKFAELKPRYGDEFALKRAMRRYEHEVRSLTGTRVGSAGHMKIFSASTPGGQNAKDYLDDLQREADEYFNSGSGKVNVEELIPFDGDALPPEKSKEMEPASLAQSVTCMRHNGAPG